MVLFSKGRRRLLGPVLLSILLSFFLGGCNAVPEPREETVTSASGLQLYFLDSEVTSIRAAAYTGEESDDPVEQCELLLAGLATPQEDLERTPPIAGFAVPSVSLEGDLLTVDLSEDYRQLEPIREILVRSAIVCTLCQVEGVSKVSFRIGGEELMQGDKPVGPMDAQLFIFNAGNELQNYESVRLHLYFAAESGDGLINTYRTVFLNNNMSMERLVAEEVFKGPNSDVVFPTLNPMSKILSVTSGDGVCYIDLNADFLNDPYDVTPQVAVYSLVNSLCALPNIESVQISVEGNVNAVFMETVPLKTPLEQNREIVLY